MLTKLFLDSSTIVPKVPWDSFITLENRIEISDLELEDQDLNLRAIALRSFVNKSITLFEPQFPHIELEGSDLKELT